MYVYKYHCAETRKQESPHIPCFPGKQDKVCVVSYLFLILDARGKGKHFNTSTIHLVIVLVLYMSKSENLEKTLTKQF